jgi:hypothetical protein
VFGFSAIIAFYSIGQDIGFVWSLRVIIAFGINPGYWFRFFTPFFQWLRILIFSLL